MRADPLAAHNVAWRSQYSNTTEYHAGGPRMPYAVGKQCDHTTHLVRPSLLVGYLPARVTFESLDRAE